MSACWLYWNGAVKRKKKWYKNILGWGAPEKRNIILLFYLFFDQMWKIVVFIFTDICIVHILFFAKERKVLWRNKLFCEHHKQILFFIWLSLMNKVSVMPLPPFCFFFNYFSCANQYVQIEQTVQVYKNIHFSLH